MPSLQAQFNDILTYANNINTRVGDLDAASAARSLTLEAKVEALEAKHKLEGAQTLLLRDQLKAKAAKIETQETQLAIQAAQVKMILARLGNASDAPVATDSNMDDATTDDHIEMPIFKAPCTGCKSTHCPFLQQAQAIKFSAEEIDTLPLNRQARDEAQEAQQMGESSSMAMEDTISLPKYSGRCFEEKAGRICKAEICPWLHEKQIAAFSAEAIAAVPQNRAELNRRTRKGA